MDVIKALRSVIRQGVVTQRDADRGRVRVKYEAAGLTSGWLNVLQRGGTALDITPDGEHGAEERDIPPHDHSGSVTGRWTPKFGQRVLCLCIPVSDGDGFVLGVIE